MSIRFYRLSAPDWSRTKVNGETYTVKPLENGWIVLQHRPDSRIYGDILTITTTEAQARDYVRALHR